MSLEALAHGAHGAGQPFPLLVGAWLAMMAAMMAPTAAPWLRAFHAFSGASAGPRAIPVSPTARATRSALFASGYLAAWLGYSVALAAVQIALQRAALLDPASSLPAPWGGLALIGAGLFQFAPLKRACLTHCRNPFTFLLQRWQNGPSGGFRLGLWHGLYCVGCCWALMATALAVGLSSLWWMAALTAVVFAEQVLPRGALARVPIGVSLVAAGLWRL